jgi:protein TonB
MFESSLISLDKKKTARRRWLSLPIAVGLHLVALATFTFAGYWHVERVADPPVNDPFIMVSLPPQAMIKQGSGSVPEKQKTAVPTRVHTEVAQPHQPAGPTPILDTPSSSSREDVVTDGPGDPNGDPNGDSRGSIFGVRGVPYNPDATDIGGIGGVVPAAVNEPIRVTGAVTRPVLLDGPQPRYTELARRAGVQGTVIVEAVIDENGRVTNVKVLKALPMGLDQAAVEAVKSWRFQPATLAGRAVKVYYTLTANFTLQR